MPQPQIFHQSSNTIRENNRETKRVLQIKKKLDKIDYEKELNALKGQLEDLKEGQKTLNKQFQLSIKIMMKLQSHYARLNMMTSKLRIRRGSLCKLTIFYIQKAQVIHKEVIRNSKRCPCCNYPISKIKYSLLTDLNEFAQHGTAYKYFLLLKNLFIFLSINLQLMLVINSIVAGIYNMIKNYKGDSCNKDKNCSQNLNNYLSILNRIDSYNFEDYILDTLYLISLQIQLGFFRYISYTENDDYNLIARLIVSLQQQNVLQK
ncbi:unnamed protein product [Paramecium octaurelia]|uniref:Transmembrane protein n=1 Tax=Paramecium octaurelia TaxID=43137 RepID=A0A8S1VNY8_PAROT|nr:unnamed protein product [Paramecium octaurelia]